MMRQKASNLVKQLGRLRLLKTEEAHHNTIGRQTEPSVARVIFDYPGVGNWYHPVMLGPTTLGELATSPDCLRRVISVLGKLESDEYTRYLLHYYRTGIKRFGNAWRYADIATVLCAAAKLARPRSYLEIGVRRGRSMAMVASLCPNCHLLGFDMWLDNYAGMENPGPDLVRAELRKVGHIGSTEFISGNSHETVAHYLARNPGITFDLITVDGDHTAEGAKQDLEDVLPYLSQGGILVFDDIAHPAHPYLADVWRQVVANDHHFTTWQFDELGYGVAFAIRRDLA